jgi:hypothetical protein
VAGACGGIAVFEQLPAAEVGGIGRPAGAMICFHLTRGVLVARRGSHCQKVEQIHEFE